MCCEVLCRRLLADETLQLPFPLMGPDRGLLDAPESYYLCDGDCYYLFLIVVGLVFQDICNMPVHWLPCSVETLPEVSRSSSEWDG